MFEDIHQSFLCKKHCSSSTSNEFLYKNFYSCINLVIQEIRK